MWLPLSTGHASGPAASTAAEAQHRAPPTLPGPPAHAHAAPAQHHAPTYPLTLSSASTSPSEGGGRTTRRGTARRSADSGRKRRFLWDQELHRAFIAAVFDIGVRQATPKSLFEAMQAIMADGMPPELDDGQPIVGAGRGLAGYGGKDGPLHSSGLAKAVHGGSKAKGKRAGQKKAAASADVPDAVRDMSVLRHDGCPDTMTSEHIKSHLQKFRANVRRSRDAFLQDYSRVMREARARAGHEEARTGAVANPPGFSTFPMAVPAHRQADRAPLHRPDGSLIFPPAMEERFRVKLAKASRRRGGGARAAGRDDAVRRSKRSRGGSVASHPDVADAPAPAASMWPGGAAAADDIEVDVPLAQATGQGPLLAVPAEAAAALSHGDGGDLFRRSCGPDPADPSAARVDAMAVARTLRAALEAEGAHLPGAVGALLREEMPPQSGGKRPRLAAGAAAAPLREAAAAALRALTVLASAQGGALPGGEEAAAPPLPAVARLRLGAVRSALNEAGVDTTSLEWPLLPPGATGPVGPHHWRDPQWTAALELGVEAEVPPSAAVSRSQTGRPHGASNVPVPGTMALAGPAGSAPLAGLRASGASFGSLRSRAPSGHGFPHAPPQPGPGVAVPLPGVPTAPSGAVALATVPSSLDGLIKSMQKRQTVHQTMREQQADHARKYSAHPSAVLSAQQLIEVRPPSAHSHDASNASRRRASSLGLGLGMGLDGQTPAGGDRDDGASPALFGFLADSFQ